MDDLKESILADPCLMRFNHNCLVVLRTNFLARGFGYVVCQPGTNAAFKQAMAAFQVGHDFTFMTTDSSVMLHPVAFGGRCCRGNEICLHSHLDEGFAGNWAINKNCHYLFGTRFLWVTDCYARQQPGHSLAADAAYVLGRDHHSSEQHLPSRR